jgi:hypothetical protein
MCFHRRQKNKLYVFFTSNSCNIMAYKNMKKNKKKSKRLNYFKILKKRHLIAKNKYFKNHPVSLLISWIKSLIKKFKNGN